MNATKGRIVHYTLSDQDSRAINRRRVARTQDAAWPGGAQAHVGNATGAGDVLPMMIVQVWSDNVVNGQVYLDGNDVLWVTSVPFSETPSVPGSYVQGSWCWPPRE
ncbi:MAG: hypothetical protein OEW90_00980 [Betaproteobacteria bacterium]|nr:hypothetical protein [Betaproteobacteria bacterium]MDH4322691.1 hypothetical protein [Betaproteobacteria bacterium]